MPHHRALEQTGWWRVEGLLPQQSLRFLEAERTRLRGQIDVPRPWHYGELHNPWSRAAAVYDSWGFLDLCQSPVLVEALAQLIGPDIILFDSQWLPDPWQFADVGPALESDAHRFPIDPPSGMTALFAVADTSSVTLHVEHRSAPLSLELSRGQMLLLDPGTPYCVPATLAPGLPAWYAVRYFSASSRYLRDPSIPAHLALTERYPLFNYATLPLWLIQGRDRAENDFVTGFNVRAGFWASVNW